MTLATQACAAAQRAIWHPQERTQAHDAMALALRCDWEHWWAMLPFAPVEIDGAWWIAASDTLDANGDILLIDGVTGAMRWADDTRAVGFWGSRNVTGDLRLFANGLNLAREWVLARRAAMHRVKLAGPAHAVPSMLEHGYLPGLAMIGAPHRIGNFAAVLSADCIEIDIPQLRQPLAEAILKAARLPTVSVRRPQLVAA